MASGPGAEGDDGAGLRGPFSLQRGFVGWVPTSIEADKEYSMLPQSPLLGLLEAVG